MGAGLKIVNKIFESMPDEDKELIGTGAYLAVLSIVTLIDTDKKIQQELLEYLRE